MAGAKVEILGRIQALDNPDCTLLQIQPSGKKVWFLAGVPHTAYGYFQIYAL